MRARGYLLSPVTMYQTLGWGLVTVLSALFLTHPCYRRTIVVMNSVYGQAIVTFFIVNVALVAQVNSLLESGQLIKTDSCTCSEGIITYRCTIDVSQTGGLTIWNGTAFSCSPFNRILLRHNLFDSPTGAFGSCNNGIISGQSLRVSSDGTNIYTSQLQVNVTDNSRSGLVGRTVQCVYSPDATIFNIINSTIIAITDPLPPPNDVQLTHVTSNQLTFNWSSVQPDCSTLQYRIESNCGTCVNQQPTSMLILSSATCSFELPINSNDVCNFAVRSTICANSIIGSLSTPVRVTLKLPDSPMIQSVIPTYNKETKSLINAEVIFADVDSFNISSIIDGAALYYVMDFIDSNLRMCNSSNISASSCDGNRICTVPLVDLTGCSQNGKINLSLSAFNLLGGGQVTNYSIDGTNQYFDVLFESATRVVCSFRDQPENQFLRNKSCNITYGPCGQTSSTTMTAQNMISSDSLTVVIDLESQLANGYCYTVTASNGASSTVKIQGTFTDSQGTRTVAIAVGVVVPVLVIIITLAIIILTAVIILRKHWRYRGSGRQEVHRRPLLDDTDSGSGDNVISPHIIYDLEDRPEKFTESLRTLSQNNVNIKNIKICPSVMDKSQRTVYVECDHNLEEEVKEKLENEATQLGLPGTLRVSTEPESLKIEKDEDASSKRVQEIEEVLKHEPGALYSLLETFQRAEDLRHISITDIIHDNVPERENCKKVVIKFIPELPRTWKDNYNIRRKECDFIVSDSMSDESTSLL